MQNGASGNDTVEVAAKMTLQDVRNGLSKSPCCFCIDPDELRCVLYLINGTVIADHFRETGFEQAAGNCSVVLAIHCRSWWELEVGVVVVR
jgi:hypothetical protein